VEKGVIEIRSSEPLIEIGSITIGKKRYIPVHIDTFDTDKSTECKQTFMEESRFLDFFTYPSEE
jgi:hypothetical protein